MSSATSTGKKPQVYSAGQKHSMKCLACVIHESTFDETFQKFGLTEKPGEHSYQGRMGTDLEGLPIAGKWLYVFAAMGKENTCVVSEKVAKEKETFMLFEGTLHVAFLSSTPLSKERVAFYTQTKNHRALADRSIAFYPEELNSPVVLTDFIEMAQRLSKGYALCCERSAQLLSSQKVQLAHFVGETCRTNKEFSHATQSDFPEILAFDVQAKREISRLQHDMVQRQKALEAIKLTPGFARSMEDLLSDKSNVDKAIEAWDKTTTEDEISYFKKLANPDPKKASLSDWYNQLQLARPISQMIAGGGLHSALRKMLIMRYMILETKELKVAKGKDGAKKAMKAFASEVEALLNDKPSLRMGLAKSGEMTFHLTETASKANKFDYSWSPSHNEGSVSIQSKGIGYDARFAKLQGAEKQMLSIGGAVEILNVYLSYQCYQDERAQGKDNASAKLGHVNDAAGALGAMVTLGSAASKGERVAVLVGTELAESTGAILGRAAAGLGLVGAVLGTGLAVAGAIDGVKNNDSDKGVSQAISAGSNALGILVGAFQIAGMFGASGPLVAAATGPIGVGAIFLVAGFAAFYTWKVSPNAKKWPHNSKHEFGKAGIHWKATQIEPETKTVVECLAAQLGDLVGLLYPIDVILRINRIDGTSMGSPGSNAGGNSSETLVFETHVEPWMTSKTKVILKEIVIDPAFHYQPFTGPEFTYNPAAPVEISRETSRLELLTAHGNISNGFQVPSGSSERGREYSLKAQLDLYGDGKVLSGFKTIEGKVLINRIHTR